MKNNIKHLTIHLNVLEIHYKSIYTQLESVHKLSVHIGLILPRLCLLLCPILLRKWKILCRSVPLPKGNLGLSLESMAFLSLVLFLESNMLETTVLDSCSSYASSPFVGTQFSLSCTGPGESGSYTGDLGT